MNPVEIIVRKRDGGKLSGEQIEFMVRRYTAGEIPDYQMSAFLMAVFCRSMDTEETAWLTRAMLDSGEKISFPSSDFRYVDKHSSGGIGDKVSIVLAPLMAACGLKVPMLSGRGLGHTGGTLDKLESIPGFRTDLSIEEFKIGVESVGCVISGQTPEIAPADRKIYALRDVTGTVESIPLICGSILSKKLAAGPNAIVFDIKCGNGAFMQSLNQATQLGESLCRICEAMGKKSAFLISDMSQPLGRAAGNALEIDECLQCLRGQGPADLRQLTLILGAKMLSLSGTVSGAEAMNMMNTAIVSGAAYDKFIEMVKFQGGSTDALQKSTSLRPAERVLTINAACDGYLEWIDTRQIGMLIIEMGGGRMKLGEKIDHSAGIVFHKKIGDFTACGDIIAEIHSSEKIPADYLKTRFLSLIRFSKAAVEAPPLILQDFQ